MIPSDCLSTIHHFPGAPVIGGPASHPRRNGAQEALSSSQDNRPTVPHPLRRRILRYPLQAPRYRPWPSPIIHRLGFLLVPGFREGFVTTLQVSLHATDRPFARPPRVGTLSFRFDARISPHAGNQLPGTLASPRTGRTPAGCPELIVRFTTPSLTCGARTAGRTGYAKPSLEK